MRRRIPESRRLEQAEALSLSGPALTELLQAVVRKKLPCRFRASGSSMAPFIKDGDILTVAPPAAAAPRVGDVAAFSHPADGRLAVHRIVAQGQSFYRLKGDALDAADGVVPKAHIIGVICRVERNGRRVSFGLGPERFMIARLSAAGLLTRALSRLGRLYRNLRRVR